MHWKTLKDSQSAYRGWWWEDQQRRKEMINEKDKFELKQRVWTVPTKFRKEPVGQTSWIYKLLERDTEARKIVWIILQLKIYQHLKWHYSTEESLERFGRWIGLWRRNFTISGGAQRQLLILCSGFTPAMFRALCDDRDGTSVGPLKIKSRPLTLCSRKYFCAYNYPH